MYPCKLNKHDDKNQKKLSEPNRAEQNRIFTFVWTLFKRQNSKKDVGSKHNLKIVVIGMMIKLIRQIVA